MKIRVLAAVAALFLAGSGLARGDSNENYLPNPGFEQGMKFWAPWKVQDATITTDDVVFHSGKKSLLLEWKEFDRRKETYIFAYNIISECFTAGGTYTASGWLRIGNVPAGKKGPVAFLQDGSGKGESQHVEGPTDPQKDGGWVFVSFQFKATEKDRGLCLRCMCDVPQDCVPGTVWFDDLKVEEGATPTAFRPDWIPDTDFYTRGKFIYFPMSPDYRCSMEVVTPHVELAKPGVGAPLRLLWAGFWFSGRQACELAQRGDFQLDSMVFNGSNARPAYWQRIHEKCIAVFRERLGVEPFMTGDEPLRAENKVPQVLVLEQGSLESLAKHERDAILDRVKEGMGCVILLGPTFSDKLPGETRPWFTRKLKELADGVAKMTEPGHGSLVTVLNPSSDEKHWNDTFGIEWTHGEVIRAIYRSVTRPLTDVRITAAPARPKAGDAVKVTVSSAAGAARIRVFPNLPVPGYDAYGQGHGMGMPRDAVADIPVELADGAATVALPALAAGEYFLEAQALDPDKRVLGWTLSKLTVASPISVVKLDAGAAAFTAAGQPLSVVCTVKNAAAPMGATLVALVYDPLGRLLAVSPPVPVTLNPGETNTQVSVALTHAELCSARVEVQVKNKEQIMASSSIWTSTESLMTRIDFNTGPYDDYYLGARNFGADMAVDRKPELGMRPFDWVDIFAGSKKQGLSDKDICDPAVLDAAKQRIAVAVKSQAPLHDLACLLHDELGDFGFRGEPSEYQLTFFRENLKGTYKTIAALNTSWGTNFGDWAQIDAKAVNFIPAAANMNPAPWADWQRASELAAHKFYGALDVAAREMDPTMRIGCSGTRATTGTDGIDWWLLTQDLRSVALYDGIHDEMYHSFAGPDHMMTQWSHLGASDADYVHCRIWSDVCRQRKGTPTYGGRVTNLFYPDYRRNPPGVSFYDELAVIRMGYGRLILGTQPDDRSVAIFYSPACYRAQIVQGKKFDAAGTFEESLDSLFGALSDAGIKPHFVSYEQVSRGDLKPETTKVLCLWGALALSQAEAEAVRQYANAGGVLLADTEPGVYDEHCHKLAQGRLDGLFGKIGEVRPVGRGKAILFGAAGHYMNLVGYGTGGEAAVAQRSAEGGEFLAKLSAVLGHEAGITAAFTLTDAQGRNAFKKMEGYIYADGPARYLALVPEGKYGDTQKVRLTLKGGGQLYDCRAGKCLGAPAAQDVELRLATANIFALLPYKVEKVLLAAPATATLGQPIHVKAALQTGAGQPVRHVLVVQLRRPDGKDLPVHRWTYETRNRSIEADVFLALNDPAGNWTLVVYDAATGVRQEQPIEVQPAAAVL